MKGVLMTKMVQELNLTNLTPEIDLSDKKIITAEINRPALQLTIASGLLSSIPKYPLASGNIFKMRNA